MQNKTISEPTTLPSLWRGQGSDGLRLKQTLLLVSNTEQYRNKYSAEAEAETGAAARQGQRQWEGQRQARGIVNERRVSTYVN